MNGVYNRKLFSKKATEARDKLRELGGVAPTSSPQVGGIMASSPELMQAAMRRPVVLPPTQAPVPMAPAPQPSAPMLPPSQPIPNIAGIPQGPMSTAPAPRPVAQKPGVRKLNEGGEPIPAYMKGAAEVFSIASDLNPQLRTFKDAFKFGQRAITTEDPTKLGLPESANMAEPAKMLEEDPEGAAADIIADTVPKDQHTGDTKTDLRKAATMTGIERVPAEAEIDELNKAIFGAKLAGAIAGSYVNPQTGQELRPTAGARIANAAVEGLAVRRDTETRRAEQEAALAKARIAANAKKDTSEGWFGTDEGKFYKDTLKNYTMGGSRTIENAHKELKTLYPEIARRAEIAGGFGAGGDQVVEEKITTETRDMPPSDLTGKYFHDRETDNVFENTEDGQFLIGKMREDGTVERVTRTKVK